MFAVAIDGEFVGLRDFAGVRGALRMGGRVEVASYDSGLRAWVPVCLEQFGIALAA